jgi:2-polyprenyl-6-methoxyphenol hydroxylase-like FAD-dependent oxidoreductase
MTVIAARCDAVYAADCSRSTVRRMLGAETSHGEDSRSGVVRPLDGDGGVGLDPSVRHDHDRIFGGKGIGVRVEGKVEGGDGTRV